MSGWGVCYNEGGVVVYEGNFERGKRNGFGVGYNYLGVKNFEGYWEKGLRSGFGVLLNRKNEKIYEGRWMGGCKDGVGKKNDDNGKMQYAGVFEKNRLMDIFIDKNFGGDEVRVGHDTVYLGIMDGECDLEQGQGSLFKRDKGLLLFEGGWCLGKRDGFGREYKLESNPNTFETYVSYIGNFTNDKKHLCGSKYKKCGKLSHKILKAEASAGKVDFRVKFGEDGSVLDYARNI